MPIVRNFFDLAKAEIFRTYGHHVTFDRKTINKYGRSENITSGIFRDIKPWCDGTPDNETYLTTNAVDSLSSDDASDTSVSIYIEGMTRAGDDLTFVTQTIVTDASDGRTKVSLSTPLCDVTRVRGVPVGEVYVYEDTAISAGVPTDATKIHGQAVAEEGTSLQAGTSVASNNYLLITDYWATLGRAGGTAAVDVRLRIANLGSAVFGDAFHTIEPFSISLGSGVAGASDRPFIIVEPNSRLVMTARSSAGTLSMEAGFRGYFADIL